MIEALPCYSPVMRVLSPVAGYHLIVSIIPKNGEVDFKDMGTWLDDFQYSMGLLDLLLTRDSHRFHVFINESVFSNNTCFVEEVLHTFKEAGIL